MDSLNQVSKSIKQTHEDTGDQTRRISEKFPFIERKHDHVVYNNPYHMEFKNEGEKSIRLTLVIKPPEDCFQCNAGYASPDALTATAVSGTFAGGEDAVPAIYDHLSVNSAHFDLTSDGIIVPENGVYTAIFSSNVVGVTIADSAAVISSVRHNGVIVSQGLWTVAKGNLGVPPSFINVDTSLYGLCMIMRAGDSVNGWIGGTGIAFYSPTSSNLTITRVGLL